jgi:hypothetical protein
MINNTLSSLPSGSFNFLVSNYGYLIK